MKDDDIFKRILNDIIMNIKITYFICSLTGKSQNEILEMNDDELVKWIACFERAKEWKKN